MSTRVTTHSLHVPAPPDRVWPWVAQIGQERGGFYSYQWLENLVGCRITNADRIHAEWQHPHPGDRVHLHPDVALDVTEVREASRLVLHGENPQYDFSWELDVRPQVDGTLLVAHERYRASSLPARLLVRVVSWVSVPMTRRMLRGIRARATHSS